eukprot:765932-Hanusia_phi.AAC.1
MEETALYGQTYMNLPRKNHYCPTGYTNITDVKTKLNITDITTLFSDPGQFRAGCNIILPICEVVGTQTECKEWPAFFQLPVLMLMLITLLNDGALISIGYDAVVPSTIPEQWNLTRLFVVAIVLAGVACGSSLLLLFCALDSNNPNGVFAGLGIPPMEYGKIICMIYLKVSLSDFLTLFSCRTQEAPFFSHTPGKPLMVAVVVSLTISTFLASYWPEGNLDGLPVMGLARGTYTLMPLWIWIYCLIWWFIQDIFKIVTIRTILKYDLFPFQKPDMHLWKEKAGLQDNPNDPHYKV